MAYFQAHVIATIKSSGTGKVCALQPLGWTRPKFVALQYIYSCQAWVIPSEVILKQDFKIISLSPLSLFLRVCVFGACFKSVKIK